LQQVGERHGEASRSLKVSQKYMSDHAPLTEAPASTPVPAARQERRQMRRAGISLQVRLRTADFNDGNFEEVRTTLNASRKSIYFFTTLDRYYKGMRLRVTSPYDPMAGVANLEQIGEVVRVQRRNDGYGVAVALSTCGQATPVNAPAPRAYVPPAEPATHESRNRSQSERRCASRSAFVAPVELVDMRTGSRIPARTSDLSMQGCYIDTLNPLPIGAAVRAQIHRGEQVLDVLATVSSRHVGSGMGLVFADMPPAQRDVVTNWLKELRLPTQISFSNAFPASAQPPRGDGDQTYAIRLIHALVRKGLLSQSEAREILSDPEA